MGKAPPKHPFSIPKENPIAQTKNHPGTQNPSFTPLRIPTEFPCSSSFEKAFKATAFRKATRLPGSQNIEPAGSTTDPN